MPFTVLIFVHTRVKTGISQLKPLFEAFLFVFIHLLLLGEFFKNRGIPEACFFKMFHAEQITTN